MELFCCMNGRRHRALSGNPLEGRANLRLQGREDFSDSSPPEFDQESPLEGNNGRPHFSGKSSKDPAKNYEVPRRGSNGLPGAFQIGQSAGSKDMARERHEKNQASSEDQDSDVVDFSNASAEEPEKVVPRSPRADQTDQQDKEVERSSKPERKSPPKDRKSPPSESPESAASLTASQAALRDKLRGEVQDYARRLRKTASKYPSGTKEGSTGGWFAPKLKERFFDIVLVDPSDRSKAKSDKATRLGWWENEEEAKTEEALGDLPISSITEVVYKQEIEKGLQVKIVTNTKDKKGENVTLIMKFPSAKEAKSWSSDLKTFQVCFKRWSALLSEEDRLRENSAPIHGSLITTGSTFTSQATASPSSTKGRQR